MILDDLPLTALLSYMRQTTQDCSEKVFAEVLGMSDGTVPIRIIEADIFQGDLIVYFDDGSAVLFEARFLDGARNERGNVEIPEPEEDFTEE